MEESASNWRTQAMQMDDFKLKFAVEALRRHVENWIAWDAFRCAEEGIEVTEETVIDSLPTTMSHGALNIWVHILKRVESELKANEAEP